MANFNFDALLNEPNFLKSKMVPLVSGAMMDFSIEAMVRSFTPEQQIELAKLVIDFILKSTASAASENVADYTEAQANKIINDLIEEYTFDTEEE